MALSGTMAATVINDPNDDFPYIQALDLAPSPAATGWCCIVRGSESDRSACGRTGPGVHGVSGGALRRGRAAGHTRPDVRRAGRWRDGVYLAVAASGPAARWRGARELDPASLMLKRYDHLVASERDQAPDPIPLSSGEAIPAAET